MFREYPYLYEENMNDEYNYLNWFSQQKNSIVIVAYYNEKPIGFVTGIDFIDFDAHFNDSIDIFKAGQLDPREYFYIAECIILPKYRGKHLCTKLLEELEHFAQAKGYNACCFVSEEHYTHPLKPDNYVPLNRLFKHLGYAKTSLQIPFSWLTLQLNDMSQKQEHILTYWIKKIT